MTTTELITKLREAHATTHTRTLMDNAADALETAYYEQHIAQVEIERLKYQLELRRSQFESAEFAVNELKRERDELFARRDEPCSAAINAKGSL